MTLRQQLKSSRRSHKAWLYSVVFTGKISIAAVLLLLVSFCIQPFHQAMAAEDGVFEVSEPPAPDALDVAEQVLDSDVAEVVSEEEISAEQEILEETEVIEEVTTQDTASDGEGVSEPAEEIITENTDTDSSTTDTSTSTEDNSGGASDNENTSTTSSEVNEAGDGDTSTDNSSQGDETTNSSSTSTEEIADEVVEEVEPVVGEVNEIQPLVTDENYYQFSKKACVPVGDGTYHCTSKESSLYDASSVVYADRGESGNMEIFLRTSRGTVEQITDNNYDDTAPHYDAESGQIVWQRLINGRYQIVSYSIDDTQETQLTFSKTNNMEPKASAAGIVWQAWDNNDWEIMYFDGEYAEQITDNLLQDVTPVIQDGYIVWSIIGGEEQEAKVYSLDSGEILTISGYEGGTIANPRFVLVYDTKFENGDVITQGFDPETGLSKPIAAQPAQEPVNLPHNDPTGEIRSLIQKSSDDEDLSLEQANGDGGSTSSTTLDLAGAKIIKDTSTLDLSQASSSDFAFDDVPTTTIKKLELTDFDLVITGASSTDEDDVASSTPSS